MIENARRKHSPAAVVVAMDPATLGPPRKRPPAVVTPSRTAGQSVSSCIHNLRARRKGVGVEAPRKRRTCRHDGVPSAVRMDMLLTSANPASSRRTMFVGTAARMGTRSGTATPSVGASVGAGPFNAEVQVQLIESRQPHPFVKEMTIPLLPSPHGSDGKPSRDRNR